MKNDFIHVVLAVCLVMQLSEISLADDAVQLSRQDDQQNNVAPSGYRSLFDGKSLAGWKVPEGDNGHWKVVDGTIDCDARSEAMGSKDLWSVEKFSDFVLLIDWRIKPEPGFINKVPVILPDGNHQLDGNGQEIKVEIEDWDSGVFVRGHDDYQINIWMWPIGSGDISTFRLNRNLPSEVRAACTPQKRMDKPRGEWNTFEITVRKDRVAVKLNGQEIISEVALPRMPERGEIGLQHHAIWDQQAGRWTGPPSLMQFRNIFIKELQ